MEVTQETNDMKKSRLEDLKNWYSRSLGKLVFLFLILVFFTLTTVYIPFLNVVTTPSVGFGLFIIGWYMLFSPTTKVIVGISLVTLLIEFLFTFFSVEFLVEAIAEFLFLLLIFIFVNYIKEEKKD